MAEQQWLPIKNKLFNPVSFCLQDYFSPLPPKISKPTANRTNQNIKRINDLQWKKKPKDFLLLKKPAGGY